MKYALLIHTALAPLVLSGLALAQVPAASSIWMIDLNGDRHRDMLEARADGSLMLSLGLGARQFEEVQQV